ncbi:Retrovirus-related Pol polyprotein from transposon RE1 [Bienertia sinuspersici]
MAATVKYEPFSTYYLHPLEGIDTIISPILLKGNNYEEWSRSIRNNFCAKNKLGFIDGTITMPKSDSDDFAQWGIVNSMLVAWIYNTLDVSIRSIVRLPDEAKVLWDDLKDRYSLGNGPRIVELKAQITNCRQNSRSVASYYGELRKLQDELLSYHKIPTSTCSTAADFVKLQESELLHQFCLGLDSRKFGSAVSTLLIQDPPPMLNVAYSRIIADERKQLVSETQVIDRSTVVGFAINTSTTPVQSSCTRDHDGPRTKCAHRSRLGHAQE